MKVGCLSTMQTFGTHPMKRISLQGVAQKSGCLTHSSLVLMQTKLKKNYARGSTRGSSDWKEHLLHSQ